MHVLLTGGYGCIGAWITRNLLQRGDQVFIYDLKEDLHRLRLIRSEEQLSAVRFIQGDVTDLATLGRAIHDHGISHVVHLAGLQVPICRSDPLLGAKVNVLGTLAVFEAVRQSQEQVQRLVYASSAAVFGPPEVYHPDTCQIELEDFPVCFEEKERPRPLLDDVPLKPTTHYGVFKCCNEGNARIYYQDHGLSSIGLRPWTVYGVGRDFGMTSGPTKAIKAVAVGRPYHIKYGGCQDLQYVDDVANVIIRCLESPYQGAKSYNLRGDVVHMEDFLRALCSVEPAAASFISYDDRQLPIAYDLDDGALQRDLGPMPHTPLVEGIRQTLDQFRQLHAEGRLDLSDLQM